MRTIHKYLLDISHDKQTIVVPASHKLLTVQMQGDVPCMWLAVEVTVKTETAVRKIHCIGTGWELPPNWELAWDYIGTVQDGPFVWHFFWEKDVS